ncbi:hypothetical protein NliqN6_5618 [Naganishia liquefaciens]|uniref:Uncharacterized protein n=1 Tax=Naganishia liquefaciens TaxID=104408 RepID=A0A8H3YJ60_9TREE|nr:hypothetical protein NliqN6_5618 [Naganishia liquefaciens]
MAGNAGSHPSPQPFQLSPLQVFAQTAGYHQRQATTDSHASDSAPGGINFPGGNGQNARDAWERNLITTASLRGMICELSEGWQRCSSTLQDLMSVVQDIKSELSRTNLTRTCGECGSQSRSNLIGELNATKRSAVEETTPELSSSVTVQVLQLADEVRSIKEEVVAGQTGLAAICNGLAETTSKMVEIGRRIETHFASDEMLSGTVQEHSAILHKIEILIGASQARDAQRHVNQAYTSKLQVVNLEGVEPVEPCFQRSLNELRDGLETSLQAKLDESLREMQKETISAIKPFEQIVASIFSIQTVGRRHLFQFNGKLTSESIHKDLKQYMEVRGRKSNLTGAFVTPERRENPLIDLGNMLPNGVANITVRDSLRGAIATATERNEFTPQSSMKTEFDDHMNSDQPPCTKADGNGWADGTIPALWTAAPGSTDSAKRDKVDSRASSGSGKKRMLMTFSSDDEEVEARPQSTKRTRNSPEKRGPPTTADSNLPQTEQSAAHRNPNDGTPASSNEQNMTFTQLLEGVPMQSRRRLSVSPEADENLNEIECAQCS